MIVHIKGVKRVRSKGKDYFYYRKTMTPLPGVLGSAEFMVRLRELEKRAAKVSAQPNTLGGLVLAYKNSPEWTRLASTTHRYYQKVFDRLKPNGEILLSSISSAMLYGLRDKLAIERKRAFTNATIVVLRLLFAWAIKREMMKTNPALAVDVIPRPRGSPIVNRPWKPDELEVVLREFPDWMRVVVVLAAYTGMRSSDLVRVTWACYDGASFEARSQKTNVPIWIPAHYRLRAVLDATPRRSPLIVVGARGRPLSLSGLRNSLHRFLAPLVESGKVGFGLSLHGLRHTLGTALAELGCDPRMIGSVLGHETIQSSAHYSRHADRRLLATTAIERLENSTRKTDRKTTT